MRRRFGRRRSTRRRTFGGSALALLVGVLAIVAWMVRRRGDAEVVRESYRTGRERFGEARERQTRYAADLSERVTGGLKAGAESVRAASQELAEQAQEREREAGEDRAPSTEEAEKGPEEDIRSIIRESVKRSRGEA